MSSAMTVKDLKKLLKGVPDDAVVLVPARDHHYRGAGVQVGDAVVDEHPDVRCVTYTEFYEKVRLDKHERRIKAVIIT